ncbi:cytochrome P450 302a1, mitochondrial-like [Sitophilus oryzae]|uniref:Cytochrome P450 302a1, mitochondrial-like n=1 Tax=Sitophilus oryzae TaxID=7048 RepID=A0A6J2X9K5_SITOR|nr:cytochrome P450 302a1, mitochondrial-like [Sitophilus oryzae]
MEKIKFKLILKQSDIKIICNRGVKSFSRIPGPKSLSGIGTLYKYLPLIGEYKFDELHHNGLKKYKKYGPVVREEIVPNVNIVWLFDPNDIEVMFRCEGKYPQRRSHLALQKFRLDRPHVYNTGGLLPTNGPDWYKIRKIFQKGLSGPLAVKRFLSGSDEIIKEWLGRIESNRNNPEADFLPELSRLFLELTGYTTLDLRLDSFSEDELDKHSRSSKLIDAALTTNSCVLKLDNGPQMWRCFNTPLYRKLKKSQLYMEDTAIDLLSLKMSIFSEKDINKDDTLLQQYLSCPDLEFKDIIGMVCDFLLAGIDTTTYSTSFLFYHIAKAPAVQISLFEESKRLLPEKNSKINEDILNGAQYTRAVVKELFRLRPISVGVGRVLNEEAVFSDYSVPKDTVVVSQNQVSCRLDTYFPKAHEFRPERWLKDHPLYEKKHPYLLLPFGHGPRSCIARHLAEQNMQLLLLNVIRNYKMNGGDQC